MTKLEKLIMAKQQLDNVVDLTKGNEWEGFIYHRLTSVWYELDRQIKLLEQ